MSKFLKIGERVINLDRLVFADFGMEDGVASVNLCFERMTRFSVLMGEPVTKGTKDDPHVIPLNMHLTGENAVVFWRKLCELSETWELPSEIDPEKKPFWPRWR